MRWLLALSGLLQGIISVIYLIRQETDSPLTFHAWHGTVTFAGKLMLAAGLCAMAAGVWSSRKSKSWLLIPNGLACSALGAIFAFWTGPLAFRTVALLIVVMAISISIYELAAGREWLIRAAGVVSLGFAVAFLAFVFRWIKLNPGSPAESLHWLGAYFAFSALCMLALARHRRPDLSFSRAISV